MAKKIRLDFSKVEERSGYNSRQMPEGLYEAKISGIVHKDAPDGTAMLVYALSPTQQKYATRNFPYYCKLQQNQLWKLRDLFVAAGETIPKKATQIDPDKVIGAKVAIEVGDDTGQYSDRSVIVSVYPLSTLEDLDDEDGDEESDEPEEGDDEYEDEDEESGDDFEDDDEDLDDDEDEDDDLDEDDDDLDEDDEDDDDEDLDDDEEDEDEEDEEEDEDEEDEEPAPAPKRAAKRAPAKKTASKPAAKPAAKRTVKRAR